MQWTSVDEEADGIAAFIERRVADGVDPGKCLVLAPTRHVGYAIRDAVRRHGIEIGSFFREEAVETEATQRALILLTLLARPDDRVALRAWLAFGSSIQRRGPYRRVLRVAQEEGIDVAEVLAKMDAGMLKVSHAGGLLDPWRALQMRLAELRPVAEDLSALCEVLFPSSLAEVDEEDEFAVIRALALAAAEESDSPLRFSEMLRYRIAEPEVPLETPYARVMSFHKSKGLTADLVVLAGLVQGAIPRIDESQPHPEQVAALQEQRRLFFVGMTRTTNVLMFSSYAELDFATAKRLGASTGAHLRGRGREAVYRVVASQFLNELGPHLPAAVRGDEWRY